MKLDVTSLKTHLEQSSVCVCVCVSESLMQIAEQMGGSWGCRRWGVGADEQLKVKVRTDSTIRNNE